MWTDKPHHQYKSRLHSAKSKSIVSEICASAGAEWPFSHRAETEWACANGLWLLLLKVSLGLWQWKAQEGHWSRLGHIPYKFRQNYLFGLTTSSDYSTSSHHHQAKNRQASAYSPMYPKRLWEEVLERWTQNNWPLPPWSANTKWHQIKPWGKRVKRNPMDTSYWSTAKRLATQRYGHERTSLYTEVNTGMHLFSIKHKSTVSGSRGPKA